MNAKTLASYDPAWLAALEEVILDFTHVLEFKMLKYLEENFPSITNTEKKGQLKET